MWVPLLVVSLCVRVCWLAMSFPWLCCLPPFFLIYNIGTTTSTIHILPPRRFLLALRDALALAHALGRTLVLPAPHCFCDRFDPFRALTATNPLPPSTTSHSSLCTPHHWTRLRLTSVPPSSLLELHPPSAPTASATGRRRPLPAPLFFIFLPSVLPLFSSAAFLHPTSPVTD